MAEPRYPAKEKYKHGEAAENYATRRFRPDVDEREHAMVRGLVARCEGARRILDAPCGTGRMTSFATGAELSVALDVSYDMVARVDPASARRIVGDCERLPLRADACDLALSIRFLHHLPSEELLERCLRELARVSSRWVLVSYYRSTTLQYARRVLKRILSGRTSHRIGRTWRQFRAVATRACLRPAAVRTSAPFISEQYFVLFEKVVDGEARGESAGSAGARAPQR